MSTFDWFIDRNNLPKALSKKDIYELLDKINQGDDSARKTLIEHNIRLVLYEVKNKFNSVEYDKRDLVSIGTIGLLKAIKSFDTEKNVEFATYATRCIDNEILMFLRKIKKDQNIDSLNRIISNDKDGSELKIEDIISDDTDIIEEYNDKETYQIIRQIVKELPDRDREIIMLYFGFYNDKTYTQREISDKLSISQSYVCRLIDKIVKKIGFKLEQAEGINKKASIKNKEKLPNSKMEVKDKMPKKLQTIYEYFNKYTREQVDEMLSKLDNDDKELVTLRYGEDLDNPTISKLWDKEKTSQYYGSLIPKMKKLLENPNYKFRSKKARVPKSDINSKEQVLESKDDSKLDNKNSNQKHNITEQISKDTKEIEPIIKDDYIRVLELLKTQNFSQMLNVLTPKEAIIICLKLGYVDGKYFNTESISEFLGIEPDEVRESTKKVLLLYRESINDFIDKAVEYALDNQNPNSFIRRKK